MSKTAANTLVKIGNSTAIENKETKIKINFKSLEKLTDHINKHGLKDEIDNLEILPKFYQELIGFKLATPALQDGRIIGDVISDVLMSSGFTNPSLIQ